MPLLLQGLAAVGASIALTFLIDDEPSQLDTIKSKFNIQNVAAGLGIIAAGVTIYKFYKGKK